MNKLCLATATAALLTLAAEAAANPTTFYGSPQAIGSGSIRSFVTVNDRGHPTEVGLILSETALANLPDTSTEYQLPLPRQAATTAFTHIGVNWSPQGHPPGPIYGTPHFDLHFYTIQPQERQRITLDQPAQLYKSPPAGFVPTDYVLALDSGEPGQGSHWVDPTAPEFQGAPRGFEQTFIYGFYNGKMTFQEPMIAKSIFDQRQSFTQPIKLPRLYSKSGFYPTQYGLSYDTAKREYRVFLDKMQRHGGKAGPELPQAAEPAPPAEVKFSNQKATKPGHH
jgi:hypothetical protein